MIEQTLDGIPFRMKTPFDFGFVSRWGKVFRVFDDQDSGNICFGTEQNGWKYYGLPAPCTEILAYPVITMNEFTHEESRNNFLQENAENTEMRDKWSVEKQITPNYPPSFVWQCDRDNAVPIQNTQLLVAALKEMNVDCEYITYDSEWHGWGSGKGTLAEGWTKDAVKFWKTHMK